MDKEKADVYAEEKCLCLHKVSQSYQCQLTDPDCVSFAAKLDSKVNPLLHNLAHCDKCWARKCPFQGMEILRR